MCLIFHQWDKIQGNFPLLHPLSIPRAQSHGAVKGFWLHGQTAPFLVGLPLNWA